MSHTQPLEREEVVDPVTLAKYAQQRVGIPYPTVKDMTILRKKAKWFLDNNPEASWQTFVRVLDWIKAKHKHPATVWWLVDAAKWAYGDGYLPELAAKERTDSELETEINAALEVETDLTWRRRLNTATGVEARRDVLEEWRECQSS